jgi:Acetyl-CoA carboxylase alpha subunit
VADEVWMLENAVYSVISPEGCASILWKDESKAREAARCLKMTAQDLLELDAIEKVVPEAERSFAQICEGLKTDLLDTFRRETALGTDDLLQRRYERFRKFGAVQNS